MRLNRRDQVLLPILLCSLSVFQIVTGLRCYQCQWMNGMGQRECLQDPPPSRFLTECNEPQCWKKYSHYNGNTNVKRFCVAVATQRSTCQPSSFPDSYSGEIPATECTCNTDGCNGSTHGQSSANYNGVMFLSVGMMLFSRVALQNFLR